MRLRSVLAVLITFFTFAGNAYADCTDIIRASVLTSTVAQDQSSLDQEVNNFCSAYSSSKASGSSFNAGGSYGGIGLSGGASKSEVDTVASTYCDSTNNYHSKQMNYNNYIQTISPIAYGSYDKCLIATQNGWVTASLDPVATHPNDLVIVMSLSFGKNAADVYFMPSAGIVCRWTAAPGLTAAISTNHARFQPGSQANISCTRVDATKAGSITITDVTNPGTSYAFPWKTYQNGLPVDELQAIKDANLALVQSLATSIVAFNATQCPNGWTEYVPARGRLVRGIDPSGNSVDPDGTRAPGNQQEDMIKKHSHTVPTLYAFGPTGGSSSGSMAPGRFFPFHSVNQTDETGADETRPKNVALLYCARN